MELCQGQYWGPGAAIEEVLMITAWDTSLGFTVRHCLACGVCVCVCAKSCSKGRKDTATLSTAVPPGLPVFAHDSALEESTMFLLFSVTLVRFPRNRLILPSHRRLSEDKKISKKNHDV